MTSIKRTLYGVAAAFMLAACSAAPPPPSPPSPQEISEDEADFRDSLSASLMSIDTFMDQTAKGKNLSDYTLGLFASSLLATLSGQDTNVSHHIFDKGRLTEGYLSDVFQYHPADEIAFFENLQTPSKPPLHLALARTLEVLQYIPDPKSDLDTQAETRADLLNALSGLKTELTALLDSRSNHQQGK